MTEIEKNLIIKYTTNKISYEEFERLFPVNVDKKYFEQELSKAFINKDSEMLSWVFALGFALDFFQEDNIDLLNKLLLEEWHESHLNIVKLLQEFKSPSSIESLYNVIFREFDYLNYTDELKIQSIWALGYYISTPEAKEKLKLLRNSENEVIRKNALEQLEFD